MTVTAEQLTRPLPDGLKLGSYVGSARLQNGVDRDLLETMVRVIGRTSGPLALCGWSDYAKHLVNLFGEDGGVLCIADDAEHRHGWTFRGVPVVPVSEAVSRQPEQFVCTRVNDRVGFLGEVTAQPDYRGQPVHCFPQPSTAEGRFYDPWQDSPFYRELRSPAAPDLPGSMLSVHKLQLLLELAKQTLHLDGDVLEVGAWQGGSAWPLARLIERYGMHKRLVLTDFFEELPRTNSEGIMCLDEIRYWFSFYPPAEVHTGNVDERPEPLTSGDWCFVHYDAGFSAERLGRCFDHLQVGGIMLLDNYGHIRANPGKFDRWFEARGHLVSSPPRSEQGWVMKHS